MDRRRWTSLLVVAVAASGSIATSPPQPTLPPRVDGTVEGTFELSAAHPVAVREFRVRVTGLDATSSGGRQASVTFTPSASGIASDDAAAGRLRTSVVAAAAGESDWPGAFRSVIDTEATPRSIDLTCAKGTCEGQFALVVNAIGRTAAEPVDVDWHVATHVDLWGGVVAGRQPAVEITVEEPAADPAAVTSASTTGANVRLDSTHRLAMWRLSMTLGDEALAAPPGWPLTVTGRLRSTSTVVTAPAEGEPREPNLFIEGVGDLTDVGIEISRPGDEIEFEPFWSCVADAPCTTDYIVGLELHDARQDIAIDAGWELDLQAVAADGRTLPVDVTAEPVPPMPMISATIRGTFVTGSDGSSGPVGYTVREAIAAAESDPQWDGLRAPTYGIFRARMTSTGSAPLPTEGFFPIFGPDAVSPALKVDEELVVGFLPGDESCRVPECDPSDRFTSGIGSRSGTLKDGWQVTIEWELELGMGTTAIGGDSKMLIDTVERESPSP
jgi:hypothetical protein